MVNRHSNCAAARGYRFLIWLRQALMLMAWIHHPICSHSVSRRRSGRGYGSTPTLQSTLTAIHSCLKPDGVLLIDLDEPDIPVMEKYLGKFKQVSQGDTRLRFAMTSLEKDEESRTLRIGMRYEREAPDGTLEVTESVWLRRLWRLDQFLQQLDQNGFERLDETPISAGLTQICVRTRNPSTEKF